MKKTNPVLSNSKKVTKKPRSIPATRPCDGCAIRRVRCDLSIVTTGKCTNCTNHNIECTNVRLRHKSGPKNLKQKTRDQIMNVINSSQDHILFQQHLQQQQQQQQHQYQQFQQSHPIGIFNTTFLQSHQTPQIITSNIRLEKILPYLQVYQSWYYGIWPVVTISELMAQVRDDCLETPMIDGKVILTKKNAPTYALCSSICAAIGRQMIHLRSSHETIGVHNTVPVEEYANDAKRILYLFDIGPTVEMLLITFFLSVYYIFLLDHENISIMYLRQGITIAHLLGMHDPNILRKKEPIIAHRYKKIFYLLLITERYTCLENNLPIILEPSIPLPKLNEDPFPELLVGFTELLQIFSAPDVPFFQEMVSQISRKKKFSENTEGEFDTPKKNSMILLDILGNHSTDWKRKWIYQLQDKLKPKDDKGSQAVTVTQKLNVVLSQSWFQALGWQVASENYLLSESDNCFSPMFPLEIAKSYLKLTTNYPDFAYEANGPGVSLKLLDIADCLNSFIKMATTIPPSSNISFSNRVEFEIVNSAYDQLNTIFNKVIKFKDDISLPKRMYQTMSTTLENRKLDMDLVNLLGFSTRNSSVPQLTYDTHQLREVTDESDCNSNSNNQPELVNSNEALEFNFLGVHQVFDGAPRYRSWTPNS